MRGKKAPPRVSSILERSTRALEVRTNKISAFLVKIALIEALFKIHEVVRQNVYSANEVVRIVRAGRGATTSSFLLRSGNRWGNHSENARKIAMMWPGFPEDPPPAVNFFGRAFDVFVNRELATLESEYLRKYHRWYGREVGELSRRPVV